jgi:transaldolase
LPEATIAAFEDHGTVATTIDSGVEDAQRTLDRLEAIGVSMTDVGRTLEDEGVASFTNSFDHLLVTLATKGAELSSSRASLP